MNKYQFVFYNVQCNKKSWLPFFYSTDFLSLLGYSQRRSGRSTNEQGWVSAEREGETEEAGD